MQIEVIKEQHNALLDRKELQIKIKHPAATPARIEVKNKVAADLKVEPDRVIVDNMKTAFGKKETIAYIKVYESTEVASQIEKEHILKRNRPSTTEPAGEAEETVTTEPAGEAEETVTTEPAGSVVTVSSASPAGSVVTVSSASPAGSVVEGRFLFRICSFSICDETSVDSYTLIYAIVSFLPKAVFILSTITRSGSTFKSAATLFFTSIRAGVAAGCLILICSSFRSSNALCCSLITSICILTPFHAYLGVIFNISCINCLAFSFLSRVIAIITMPLLGCP